MELTIGQLLDSLITTSQRVWHLQDEILECQDVNRTAAAAKELLIANAERRRLVRELDNAFSSLAEGHIVHTTHHRPTYD
jgi:hypothetical protein